MQVRNRFRANAFGLSGRCGWDCESASQPTSLGAWVPPKLIPWMIFLHYLTPRPALRERERPPNKRRKLPANIPLRLCQVKRWISNLALIVVDPGRGCVLGQKSISIFPGSQQRWFEQEDLNARMHGRVLRHWKWRSWDHRTAGLTSTDSTDRPMWQPISWRVYHHRVVIKRSRSSLQAPPSWFVHWPQT